MTSAEEQEITQICRWYTAWKTGINLRRASRYLPILTTIPSDRPKSVEKWPVCAVGLPFNCVFFYMFSVSDLTDGIHHVNEQMNEDGRSWMADGYCLIISVWTALWGARRSCHRVFVGLSNMVVYNVIQLTWCGWRISGIVADRPDLFSVTLVWLASLSRCLCV